MLIMNKNSRKPSTEDKLEKPPNFLRSMLKWFLKKNKDDLPICKFEFSSKEIDLIKHYLDGKVIKRRHKAGHKAKGSCLERNLFNLPKQLRIDEEQLIELFGKNIYQTSKVKCFNSSISLTKKQKHCNLKKVFQIKSSTLTVNCKNSSKLITPKAAYNSILTTSVPPYIIDSNLENPVFVPVRSIREKNTEPNIPPEPNVAEEAIRDLKKETKTKVIPVVVKISETLEDESWKSKTKKEFQKVVPEKNVFNQLNITSNNPLSDSSTFDCSHTQKTKSQLASKKNKRVKGKRHKARGPSSSVSWVAPDTSDSSNNLKFVFGPKAHEFTSSASATPIPTCTHGTVPVETCSKREQRATFAPIQDAKASDIQKDSNDIKNSLESIGAGFEKILGGKGAMQFLQHLYHFPLLCNVEEHNSTGEIQNLLSLVGKPDYDDCNSTAVVEKDGPKEDDVDDNVVLNNSSSPNILARENLECLSIYKIRSDEEKKNNNLLRSKNEIPESEIKTEAVYDDFPQTSDEPHENYENNPEEIQQDDTLEWLLNACEKENNKADLSITIKLKDGDKCVKRTFECLTPKLLQTSRIEEPDRITNDDYQNVVGGRKAQPNNLRSILTSSRGVDNEYEKEELKFPSMESVIPVKTFEFDSAGEGDGLCPITKVNLKSFNNEIIHFAKEEEQELLLDGSYLDRKRREMFDEKIRATVTCNTKDINLLHPSTSLAHYMAFYMMGDSMLESKNTNHNNLDCDNIYSVSEHTTPLGDHYVDTVSDIKYRSSMFYTIRDENEKFNEDLETQRNRYGLRLLEGIEEELEESEEEKVESVVDVKEKKVQEVYVQVIKDMRSVGIQTEIEGNELSKLGPCKTSSQQCKQCMNTKPLEDEPELTEPAICFNEIEQSKNEKNNLHLENDKISADDFEVQDPTLKICIPSQKYNTKHLCSHHYFFSLSGEVLNSDLDIVRDDYLLRL